MAQAIVSERALKRVEAFGFTLIGEDKPVYEQEEGKEILNALYWSTAGAYGFQYTVAAPRIT
jgi:hypothetical protein